MPGRALLGEPAFCSARRLTDGRTDRGAAGAQRRNSCCAFAAWFYRHARRLAAAQPPHSCSCSPPRCCPGCPVSPPYPPGVVTAPRFAWQRPGPAELPADRRPDRQDRGLRALALQVQSKAGLGEQGGQRWAWVGGGLRDTHTSPTLPCRARTAPAPCPLLGQRVGASPETTTLSCPCWLVPRQPNLRGTSRALLPKSAWAGFSPWKVQKWQGWGWEAEGEQWEEAGGSARGSGWGDSGSRRRGRRQKAGTARWGWGLQREQSRHRGARGGVMGWHSGAGGVWGEVGAVVWRCGRSLTRRFDVLFSY